MISPFVLPSREIVPTRVRPWYTGRDQRRRGADRGARKVAPHEGSGSTETLKVVEWCNSARGVSSTKAPASPLTLIPLSERIHPLAFSLEMIPGTRLPFLRLSSSDRLDTEAMSATVLMSMLTLTPTVILVPCIL